MYKEFYGYAYNRACKKLEHIGIKNRETEAENICSEVFLKVFEALPSFEPRHTYSYMAWIKKITDNTTINYLKNKKNFLMNMESFNKYMHPVSGRADDNEMDIEELIEGIKDHEIREIAQSLYYEGKTTEEIADDRNITHGTLRRKLFEYRKRT